MVFIALKNYYLRTSLGVQWLRLHTPNVGSEGSIPGLGNKTSHAAQCGQNRKPTTKIVDCLHWPRLLEILGNILDKYAKTDVEEWWLSIISFEYVFSTYQSIFYLFIYFGCPGSLLLQQAFSCCREQGLLSGYGAWASHCSDISCYKARALGHTGFGSCGPHLVALRHVGSSWTRDWTHVLCISRRISNHWTTREVLS